MRKAIIDLGTNTFNLLIVELRKDGDYQIVFEEQYPSMMGKGGINNKILTKEAIRRGIKSLKHHQQTLIKYQVESVIGIATSAIRTADNGDEFVNLVKEELNIDILVIDGKKEAQFIYDGVKQVVPISAEKVLIIDIGGGSIEFIISNRDGICWKNSFEIGMARILDLFHPSNPITKGEQLDIENHYKKELQPLFDALGEHQVHAIVGSSGAFDTIAAMVALESHPHLKMSKITHYEIDKNSFFNLHRRFINSTIEERMKMERMDSFRVEMIVLASIFINFIIRECDIERIWQCAFSLKEGAILQLINGEI